MDKVKHDTVTLFHGFHCAKCGWPIIDVVCNITEQPYCEHDFWLYCSNPTCVKHVGEAFDQFEPSWVKLDGE